MSHSYHFSKVVSNATAATSKKLNDAVVHEIKQDKELLDAINADPELLKDPDRLFGAKVHNVLVRWEKDEFEAEEIINTLIKAISIENKSVLLAMSKTVFDVLKVSILNKDEKLLIKNLLTCWLSVQYYYSCRLPAGYFIKLSQLLNKGVLKDEMKAGIFALLFEYFFVKGMRSAGHVKSEGGRRGQPGYFTAGGSCEELREFYSTILCQPAYHKTAEKFISELGLKVSMNNEKSFDSDGLKERKGSESDSLDADLAMKKAKELCAMEGFFRGEGGEGVYKQLMQYVAQQQHLKSNKDLNKNSENNHSSSSSVQAGTGLSMVRSTKS